MSNIISDTPEGLKQINADIRFDRATFEDGLAYLGATDAKIDQSAVLFGSFDEAAPDKLSDYDPESATIVLYAGAIVTNARSNARKMQRTWARLAREDRLSAVFNSVLAYESSRLALDSISEERKAALAKHWHNSDERLRVTGMFLGLGGAAFFSEAQGSSEPRQIAASVAGAVILGGSAYVIHSFKANRRKIDEFTQSMENLAKAREFSTSIEAAYMFGARKVIDAVLPGAKRVKPLSTQRIPHLRLAT